MPTNPGINRMCRIAAWSAVVTAPVALLAISSATASAEEISPGHTVTSGQGTVSRDATFGEVRGADDSLHAQGEVRDSMIAVPGRVPGTRARGFLPSWAGGPGIGGW